MHKITAQITDKAYQKIQESGKSVYQFVQDAVSDQINAIERKEELELMSKTLMSQYEEFGKFVERSMQKIDEKHEQNQQFINQRINDTLNKHEGAQKEYNRILNIINQHLEEMLKTNFR
jgi:predicted Fe-Mo cluster-binding NifX family protein